jgi:hypothetical protein
MSALIDSLKGTMHASGARELILGSQGPNDSLYDTSDRSDR